ncbi:trehalase-like domain-containing protein [Streptomyces sp. NPDC001455]|uniref:trehalase-like domain-containing protein n=1 Tax=Streptomyces sp. NPDC001455 TaxID=3154518 RepID=UPI00331FF56B
MNRILVPRNATPEPHALRDYALIADGERGALVGPCGDISWLCAPHWHSDAVFAALIGGPGHYSVTPRGRFVHGGYYEEGGLIWRNRWITETGIVECRDALVFPGDPHRTVLLRRVGAVDGTAENKGDTARVRAGTDHRSLRLSVPARRTAPGRGRGRLPALRFIMALAEHQQHRHEEALRWFERNRAACGTTGLFAEEFDIRQRQLRGNVPHAFVHALFLESATRLAAPPP